MSRGRLKRNKLTIILILCSIILILFEDIVPKTLHNFSNLMEGCLTFSSIAAAFLFTCLSILFSPHSVFGDPFFKGTNLDLKLADRLMWSSLLFLLMSIFSVIELFLYNYNTTTRISNVITSIWGSSIVGGVSELIYVIIVFFQIIQFIYDKRKRSN